MTALAKRIEAEVGGSPDNEVFELILDECECTQLTELTDKYVNLEKLSAVGCGLTTLKGFPSFPHLKRLDLSSNHLADGELGHLSGCPALTHILLCGNPIKEFSSLLPLREHKALCKLDLTSCALAEGDEYRDKVFENLEQLVILDGVDKEGHEDENDSDLEDGVEGEEDGEGSEDDDEDVPDDYDDEEDEDGEGEGDDDEEGDHDRGVKRKHEDDGDDDA